MKKKILGAAVSSAALLFAFGAYADGGPQPEPPPPPPAPEPAPAPEPVYEPAPSPEYHWYTTIFAGVAFGDDLEATAGFEGEEESFDVPLDAGYLLGWTLGYDNLFGGEVFKVRPEVELSFRQQDVDLEEFLGDLQQEAVREVAAVDGPVGLPDAISKPTDVLSLMGNVWLDWDLGDVTPYAGGGVGIGWADMPFIVGHVESTDFVWQVGGGLNYDLNERVFLGVGYRYFNGDFEENISDLNLSYDYRAHEVFANLGVRF